MGNTDSKLNFRKAIVSLTGSQVIDVKDESFWEQLWTEHSTMIQDIFALIPTNEIRNLRDNNPANLATLCYKITERLTKAVDNSCRTQSEQQIVLNCIRLLIRVLPYIFEDKQWNDFFWSTLPSANNTNDGSVPLAQSLLNAICDLLFCPDFTVVATKRSGPDKVDELCNIDSCEYIWEAGVGFAHPPQKNGIMEQKRTELLKLLLTCFSETMYRTPYKTEEPNKWIAYFTSSENRHVLPLFTSFLNTVCAYDPVGLLPYYSMIFSDTTEPLVEACLQILIVSLDHDMVQSPSSYDDSIGDNLFINYLSRIHRDEDFQFILKGITRLLNNPLLQSYLPNSTKKLHCHQELLVFFWKLCDFNKKFLYYVLKSSDVLDVLVPILYHLNDSRADQSRVGLMHIGVFILLLLSGERNFGVRLNKPYTATIPMDIPVFTGTHADLLITVFHKIIATGHQRLQPLFDCLLTILVNVSPYLKTLSMVASVKLLHLLEAFSTPWFLFSAPSNHHLVFFLLEIFNNIIQYQFDGNSNLIYTIIRKRHVFHNLANLPSDSTGISKCLTGRKGEHRIKIGDSASAAVLKKTDEDIQQKDLDDEREEEERDDEKSDIVEQSMEGSTPAQQAEPGTLQASLLEMPEISQITEKESAHPSSASATSDSLKEFNISDLNLEENKSVVDNQKIKEKADFKVNLKRSVTQRGGIRVSSSNGSGSNSVWTPTPEWVSSWRVKLPLQTIMRLLQVLVPQVEKICIDKGLTDESEILKFLQHGTLVGLLPVPHPILIRKYQANSGTTAWFRTYMWGVIYLRNIEPAIWYDTDVKLFEIQRV